MTSHHRRRERLAALAAAARRNVASLVFGGRIACSRDGAVHGHGTARNCLRGSARRRLLRQHDSLTRAHVVHVRLRAALSRHGARIAAVGRMLRLVAAAGGACRRAALRGAVSSLEGRGDRLLVVRADLVRCKHMPRRR